MKRAINIVLSIAGMALAILSCPCAGIDFLEGNDDVTGAILTMGADDLDVGLDPTASDYGPPQDVYTPAAEALAARLNASHDLLPCEVAATYERTLVQSEVSREIAVFDGFDPEDRDSGTLLGGVIENDQFWRLFELDPDKPVSRPGVQIRGTATNGPSEVEAFK